MDQVALHRIAEAAEVDALLVDQRSDPSFEFGFSREAGKVTAGTGF